MNAWQMFLPALAVAAVAMVPQDPVATNDKPQEPVAAAQASAELVAAATIGELHYVPLSGGTAVVVPARNIVEIRVIEDRGEHIRLELSYENGDYSLVEAQAFHLLRAGPTSRPVKIVRGNAAGMRFPRSLVQ